MKAPRSIPHGTLCTYCGEPAVAWDHYLRPYSYDCEVRRRGVSQYDANEVVPSCKECNSILHSKYIPGIVPRCQYLRKKLLSRNRALIENPTWSEEDYEEVYGSLWLYIRSRQAEKARINARISHLSLVIGMGCAKTAELHWLLFKLEAQSVEPVKRIRAILSDLLPGFNESPVRRLETQPSELGTVTTTISDGEGTAYVRH